MNTIQPAQTASIQEDLQKFFQNHHVEYAYDAERSCAVVYTTSEMGAAIVAKIQFLAEKHKTHVSHVNAHVVELWW